MIQPSEKLIRLGKFSMTECQTTEDFVFPLAVQSCAPPAPDALAAALGRFLASGHEGQKHLQEAELRQLLALCVQCGATYGQTKALGAIQAAFNKHSH